MADFVFTYVTKDLPNRFAFVGYPQSYSQITVGNGLSTCRNFL